MIPGLLDSQIKTMSGRELADHLVTLLESGESCGLKFGDVSMIATADNEDGPIEVMVTGREDFAGELASIIDSIREADRT